MTYFFQSHSQIKAHPTHIVEVLASKQNTASHHVRLDETLFYPTSGGQPNDLGRLDDVPVVDVFKQDGQVWLAVNAALEVGQQVTQHLDWDRRWDHMQQHSAQHLITALAEDHLGWSTMSFHLGEQSCHIELDTNQCAPEALDTLSRLLEEHIALNLPITSRVVSHDIYDTLNVRSRGLPAGHEGPIRLVEIEGVDLNTCGGTHVSSTAHLQCIWLTGTAKRKNHTLLSFLAGRRALAQTRAWLARESALCHLLSSAPAQHVERIETVLDELKDQKAQLKQAKESLAKAIASTLSAQTQSIVSHHIESKDMPLLQAIARHLDVDQSETLFVLTSGQTTGPFMLLGKGTQDETTRALTLKHLDARGGGRGLMFQGQANHLSGKHALLEALHLHYGQS